MKIFTRAILNLAVWVFRLRAKKVYDGELKNNLSEIRRILIMRLPGDGIGDLVTFIPTLNSFRRAYPLAHFTLLTEKTGKELIRPQGLVDEIIIWDPVKYYYAGYIDKIRMIVRLRLWRQRYDFLIASTTEKKFWLSFISFAVRARYKVCLSDNEGSLFYNVVVPSNNGQHEIDRNLDIARFLGLRTTIDYPLLKVSEDSEREIEIFLKSNGINRQDRLVIICPYGSRPSRGWEKSKYIKLSDGLIGMFGVKVIFIGNINEKDLIEDIVKAMKKKSINAGGCLSLSMLVALVKKASLFISIDTGPMHISTLMKTNTIALFGPGDFKKWNYNLPWYFAIRKETPCSPCYNFNCPLDHRCMRSISVDEVIETIKKREFLIGY